jgi:hypothetical protein
MLVGMYTFLYDARTALRSKDIVSQATLSHFLTIPLFQHAGIVIAQIPKSDAGTIIVETSEKMRWWHMFVK